MTASENTAPSTQVVDQTANDHADAKELVALTAAVVDAYRNFYTNKKMRGAADARKALQAVRVKTALMRKAIQVDKMAQLKAAKA